MSGVDQLSMADRDELEDFFGAAWNFAPNSTFSDRNDPFLDDPVLHQPPRDEMASINVNASTAPTKRSPPASPGKVKQPNLYETLQHAQMMAQAPLMVAMSPMSGLGDGCMGGLQWSPPALMMDPSMGGLMSGSPTMMMDPNQQALNMLMMQNRIKRARVSPYLGAGEAGYPMMGNYGMNVLGLRPRTVKMPLNHMTVPPSNKTSGHEAEEASKSMPLVLPFAAGNTRVKPSMAPVAASGRMGGGTLEEAFEKNLQAFLAQTKDLSWESVTVQDLKKILRQYELNASGKKAELMRRIKKIRDQYRHLVEAVEGKTNGTLDDITTRGVVQRSLREEKPEASSPESMGSEREREEKGTVMEFGSLDTLFADSLNGPASSHEFLFT